MSTSGHDDVGGRDLGSVSIMFAIGMIAVVMFIYLSVDGGGQIRESQRANDFAAEAARAGGQMIDVHQAIAGSPAKVDQHIPPGQSIEVYQAAALNYLKMVEQEDNVKFQDEIVSLDNDHTVRVTLTIDYPATYLALLGFNSTLTATGSATAVLVIS